MGYEKGIGIRKGARKKWTKLPNPKTDNQKKT